MARYSIDLVLASGRVPAFSYDALAKTLTALDSRVAFEQGGDYFAITINGDYPLVVDADGFAVGEIQNFQSADLPRLDFLAETCGVKQRIASLTQTGNLVVPGVTESDSLPAGSLNLLDQIAFDARGLTVAKASEVLHLADGDDYLCDETPRLIRIWLAAGQPRF